jgi:recombination associated protein RdgC
VGALKGSISYARFYIRGTVPDSFHDRYLEAVRLRAFRPLTVEEEDEERAGWCSIGSPFDLDLDHGKVIYNSYLNLGLRVDRWRIPGPLFKAHFAEAEAAHLAERGREKLSRREKDELKVFVARKLRRQVIPAMKTVDLSWNLVTGVVRFWSNSKGLHERLQEIFHDTFGLDLVPEGPYTTALRLGPTDAQIEAIGALEHTVFATQEA